MIARGTGRAGSISRGQTLGQTASFRQSAPETWCQSRGSGYVTAPTVTFAGGGCTAVPVATSVISGGSVTGIVFTGYSSHFEGFGCTSAPTVTFGAAPGGGTTATATANVGQMQYPPPARGRSTWQRKRAAQQGKLL